METIMTCNGLSDRGEKIAALREPTPMLITQTAPIIDVPYSGVIPERLVPGRVIYIVGTVKPKADRFAIDLTCGVKNEADIAFHFNPRFAHGYVVRNSYIASHWGIEELVAYQRNPFHQGKLFYLLILAAEECFMVSVNGTPFCSFTYRTNINLVNTLKIEGAVTLEKIEHRQVNTYPEPCPFRLNVFETVDSMSKINDRPLELPLILRLPEAFTVGNEIEISGQVKMLPVAFFINLQSGCQFWPSPQITFHINPRFLAVGGSNIVRNSWLCGEWGLEECSSVFHFRPGRSFTVNIKCEKDVYVLMVDKSLVARYRHRVDPSTVNAIYVQGDIFLHDIKLCLEKKKEEEIE